ncbi:MAG: tRNA (adenosine(37)-N6)-dimethylallyltransferase MiaA [Gammaproteobacteria bacterium]|nr:tRNA (adenosine(37)-N6)-dimethylallyltransferase MiaA [Gammaproteobacteria bacterium]
MNKVLSIMGPTASGKTDLAIRLSEKFNLEIISIDSVMLYKEFNIGSAKPNKDTLLKFPHKMVDILEPYEKYSVALFYNELINQIKIAHDLKKTPILVGGSMMYFKTFFSGGLSKLNDISIETKKYVNSMFESHSLKYLYNYLKDIDPESAKKIHPNDIYRIQRMLEIFFSNNEKPSITLKKCSKNVQYFNNLNLSILPNDRKSIHKNIEKRFNIMINDGLIEEVSFLLKKYVDLKLPAMSTIGYKEVNKYLSGSIGLNDMKEEVLSATRQLAKRQITWLRHLDSTTVYSFIDYDNIESRIEFFLAE